MVAKRVLVVPGAAVQAFLVCAVMCTKPSVMAEELSLLVPSKKHFVRAEDRDWNGKA